MHFNKVHRVPIKKNMCKTMCLLEVQRMTVHVDIMDWRCIAKRDQRRSHKKTTFYFF